MKDESVLTDLDMELAVFDSTLTNTRVCLQETIVQLAETASFLGRLRGEDAADMTHDELSNLIKREREVKYLIGAVGKAHQILSDM